LTVPVILIGYPVFDRGAAARYVVRQFQLGGFTVQLISEYDIYVSWIVPKKKKEREEDDEEVAFPDLMNLKKMANKYRRSA
jgi:hypothetical protein